MMKAKQPVTQLLPPKQVDLLRTDLEKGVLKRGCPQCGFRPFTQIKDEEGMNFDVAVYCSGCDTQFNFIPRKPVSRFRRLL